MISKLRVRRPNGFSHSFSYPTVESHRHTLGGRLGDAGGLSPLIMRFVDYFCTACVRVLLLLLYSKTRVTSSPTRTTMATVFHPDNVALVSDYKNAVFIFMFHFTIFEYGFEDITIREVCSEHWSGRAEQQKLQQRQQQHQQHRQEKHHLEYISKICE